ncbi:hypothetical protein NOCA2250006 [metagenome]|uniref:Uncharacterized protein n=1 Tax=metagenome TaxID=256318 RepID=A0A2P2C010_9ZZZZ
MPLFPSLPLLPASRGGMLRVCHLLAVVSKGKPAGARIFTFYTRLV